MQVSKDSIDLGIVVMDEKAAVSFYRDVLGLEGKASRRCRAAGCIASMRNHRYQAAEA